jgi:uncharacterized protein (TIGR03083 family)
MTAIEALRADRDALLETASGLSRAEWAAPSGCPGWTVHDVVAHVGALFWVVVDASTLPDVAGLPTEQAQERYVDERRSWSDEKVLADYEAVSAAALNALAGLVGQDFEVPLGDLGTYPAGVLPYAFAFDHFVHIRLDLFAPRGPLTGPPPSDELRVGAALDWIEAALPQQNAAAVASLSAAVEISLRGPGARTIVVGDGAVASRISCTSESFIAWVTQRAAWSYDSVDATGDEVDLKTAAGLHVF